MKECKHNWQFMEREYKTKVLGNSIVGFIPLSEYSGKAIFICSGCGRTKKEEIKSK